MPSVYVLGIGNTAFKPRIRLQPKAKSRFRRTVFLTKEYIQFIRDYHAGIKSEWVFPGGKGRVPEGHKREKVDHHLSTITGWDTLKDLFEKGGLKDTETEIYSPHIMRTFADTQLRKAERNLSV